jgi:hypothetical protein
VKTTKDKIGKTTPSNKNGRGEALKYIYKISIKVNIERQQGLKVIIDSSTTRGGVETKIARRQKGKAIKEEIGNSPLSN